MMTDKYLNIRLPSKVYKKIEIEVVKLFAELNISSAPINPFDIAKSKGYLVKKYSDLPDDISFNLVEEDIDGISLYDSELGTYIIYYDNSRPYKRIRFTIMHEIGHITLGHFQESDLAKKMADYFAAYSLAPSPIIDIYFCDDYIDIAKKFDVSEDCADYCFQRFENWQKYGGKLKNYENELIKMFS